MTLPLSPLSPISPWPSDPDPETYSAQTSAQEYLPNATDVYASIAILGSYLLFALYLFWAILPQEWGWTHWLPHREWALIVPCWIMVVVLLAYWTYAALVIYNTPSFESPNTISAMYVNVPNRPQPMARDGTESDVKGAGAVPERAHFRKRPVTQHP